MDFLFFIIFILLVAVIVISIVGELISRPPFIIKMLSLRKVANQPTWKVWRLSAIEPAVTTIISTGWLFFEKRLHTNELIASYSTHIVAQMCILAFIAWIWTAGEGCRRGRLTITVLFIRFIILSAPLIATLLGVYPPIDVEPYFDMPMAKFDVIAFASILVAFIIRGLFGIYQNWVTPNHSQFIRQQTEAQINLGRREIEDGVTLIDDFDLWNEQVALIERLKEEKGEGNSDG